MLIGISVVLCPRDANGNFPSCGSQRCLQMLPKFPGSTESPLTENCLSGPLKKCLLNCCVNMDTWETSLPNALTPYTRGGRSGLWWRALQPCLPDLLSFSRCCDLYCPTSHLSTCGTEDGCISSLAPIFHS